MAAAERAEATVGRSGGEEKLNRDRPFWRRRKAEAGAYDAGKPRRWNARSDGAPRAVKARRQTMAPARAATGVKKLIEP
ncbi:MAG: hypothetical protein GX418_00520 [Clostridiales bacterium]|nr:hypothetical protein [Clostridiales bacterium]